MEFFLRELQLSYVLTQLCPASPTMELSSDQAKEITDQIAKWNDDDYFCKNHILSGMSNSFFDQYSKKCMTAKDLWDNLRTIYQAEEASSKKFLVSNYMDFKMDDDKDVSIQVCEFQLIANDIVAAGMTLDENFHVGAIVAKLPPSWKEYRNKLKHKKNLTLDQLMQQLHIEEETRKRDKETVKEPIINAHVVLDKEKKKDSGKNNSRKFLKPKNARNFKPSTLTLPRTRSVTIVTRLITLQRIVASLRNKNLFKHYEVVVDGMLLYMGNSSSNQGNKNLFKHYEVVVDGMLLYMGNSSSNQGYWQWSHVNGMFKLSIENEIISAYIAESFDLWHQRLGHVNSNSIARMVSEGVISNCDRNHDTQCVICSRCKITKKPFKSVERTTTLLELVHSDICEMDFISRDGKHYYITFIDDHSKYAYVYPLKSKDEAFEKFKAYKAEVENKLNLKIKTIRSDRGREYMKGEFHDLCKRDGIVRQLIPSYTPQQNGVAERKNRTLIEMINWSLKGRSIRHRMSCGMEENLISLISEFGDV
ncbi:uncharacterized protein LOC143891707 [Tasmannia lanceolata]|uniref:uncharacterized protein LOC143891707 n=1 Tax=Tasmannia lanceolata TaxID=3420 RepID=UPI004063B958